MINYNKLLIVLLFVSTARKLNIDKQFKLSSYIVKIGDFY